MSGLLRCPVCHEQMPAAGLGRHAKAAGHLDAVFARFLEDHPDRAAAGARCDAAERIVPTWDHGEHERYPGADVPCRTPLARCGCQNTMCAPHGIMCDRCGRFACLRHRHSGHCPDCGPGRRRQHVAVPKHDPFSKTTTLVSRTYSRAGPPVWEAVRQHDDNQGDD